MNSLSWFLYLTDVTTNLGGVLIIAAVGGAVGMLAVTIACSFAIIDACGKEDENKIRVVRNTWIWRLATISLVCGFFACLMPGKNTMYAIAASEVGEKVARSEQAQEIASDATKALQQWIKKQIEPETKK